MISTLPGDALLGPHRPREKNYQGAATQIYASGIESGQFNSHVSRLGVTTAQIREQRQNPFTIWRPGCSFVIRQAGKRLKMPLDVGISAYL
jgi:hypothetical protein